MLSNVPTNCNMIDRVLGGGLPSESVTMVYGEPETGKTTLAIQCAVNCARQGYKTLFVDCDSTFSARRLSQIAPEGLETAEQVILMRPKSFQEQRIVLDKLGEYLTKSFGLVVFDTFTSLYRVGIALSPTKTFQLNRELNRQMALLAQTAKMVQIAVLVTSQVRSVFDEKTVSVEPVANRVLKFWADTILALKPTENPQVIRAVLEKNPKKAPVLTCHLKISEAGIHDYSRR